MRIVIAGGTGLLGRALAGELAEDGHEILVLSRSPTDYGGPFWDRLQLFQWDAKTSTGWERHADGADIFINLAGETIGGHRFLPDRWTKSKKYKIRQSRIDAGAAIVQAVERAIQKPKLLIQASAVGYYGQRRDGKVMSESSGPGDDFLASVCEEWEASTLPVEKMGVRRVILRTGLVQTPESGPLPRLLVQFRLFAGGPFGSGKQWWSWVHFEDQIRAIRFLLENPNASGPYNLTAPNPLTNKEFARTLGRVLRRPSILPIPPFAMRLLVGEAATLVLDGQNAPPQRLLEAGFTFNFPEAEQALRDLVN